MVISNFQAIIANTKNQNTMNINKSKLDIKLQDSILPETLVPARYIIIKPQHKPPIQVIRNHQLNQAPAHLTIHLLAITNLLQLPSHRQLNLGTDHHQVFHLAQENNHHQALKVVQASSSQVTMLTWAIRHLLVMKLTWATSYLQLMKVTQVSVRITEL